MNDAPNYRNEYARLKAGTNANNHLPILQGEVAWMGREHNHWVTGVTVVCLTLIGLIGLGLLVNGR